MATDFVRIWVLTIRSTQLTDFVSYTCRSLPGATVTADAQALRSEACAAGIADAGLPVRVLAALTSTLYLLLYPLLPVSLVLSFLVLRRLPGDYNACVAVTLPLCILVLLLAIVAGRPEVADRYKLEVDAFMLIAVLGLPSQLHQVIARQARPAATPLALAAPKGA